MTKLLISFEDEDLLQIDGIMEQCGLPSRASAVRLAIRRWEQGRVVEKPVDPLSVPGVQKGLGPAEESVVSPGYKLLDELAKETRGNFVAMRQRAAKLRMTKLIDDQLYVSLQFVDLVMAEKENPHYT